MRNKGVAVDLGGSAVTSTRVHADHVDWKIQTVVVRDASAESDDEDSDMLDLGDPLAPPNVATPKYQIWVSLFPGGNFLAKFYYKFLHRWSCTQTAQIALEYHSHTMGVWKSIY